MHQVNLGEQLYQEAQTRAIEAGFSSVDEYVADVVAHDLDNFDHYFTPEIINELDRVSTHAKLGGNTYTTEEVKEHFLKRSEAWQSGRTTH